MLSLFRREKPLAEVADQEIQQQKKEQLRKAHKVRRTAFLMMLMSVLLSLSVFADDDLSAVTSSVDTVVTLIGKVWTAISGNAVLVVFLGASLFSVAIAVFRRLKRAVR